jgi:hypothetical protein
MIKKSIIAIVLGFCTLLLISCAAGPNVAAHTVAANGSIAGFWLGLWHGYISSITFWISLFNHNICIYEIHNNGGWYNFGFLSGLGGSCNAAYYWYRYMV